MTDEPTISATANLGAEEVEAVRALVDVASSEDGFSGLNEAALLHLRHPREGVLHLSAHSGPTLVGYAQLDAGTGDAPVTTGEPSFSTGQIVVHPQHRRSGVGTALLAALVRRTTSPLRLWAMGNTPAARALAQRGHLVVVRELLIMTRSLADPILEPSLPEATTLRTFVVGQDEPEWLQVNARAFADHPEQGHVTRADLDDRISESWFDPAGFFLAVRGATGGTDSEHPTGRMVGFHWTKQHPERLGEVYVLGVDPSAGGGGLGRALLARGLRHLQERGNTSVQLYVEAEHTRAVRLYAGYGFSVASRDVMYAQP